MSRLTVLPLLKAHFQQQQLQYSEVYDLKAHVYDDKVGHESTVSPSHHVYT